MQNSLRILATVMFMGSFGATGAWADDDAIAAAIANEDRSAEHRERDARSRPEVILGLLDLDSGQSVADIFGGGGYYTELLVGVVGPEGTVILHNNTPFSSFVEKELQARYGDNEVPAVVLLKSEVDDLKLTSNSLDAVLMVMSYHDLYQYNPDRGWGHTDVPAFFAQIRAALRPGGKLLIVDHSARDGSGSSAAQTVHRIDAAFARQDIEGNGFRFVAGSDVLSNPDDDRTKMVFDKSIRGKTDRFVLLFEKS